LNIEHDGPRLFVAESLKMCKTPPPDRLGQTRRTSQSSEDRARLRLRICAWALCQFVCQSTGLPAAMTNVTCNRLDCYLEPLGGLETIIVVGSRQFAGTNLAPESFCPVSPGFGTDVRKLVRAHAPSLWPAHSSDTIMCWQTPCAGSANGSELHVG
jgi:hypothetical protein